MLAVLQKTSYRRTFQILRPLPLTSEGLLMPTFILHGSQGLSRPLVSVAQEECSTCQRIEPLSASCCWGWAFRGYDMQQGWRAHGRRQPPPPPALELPPNQGPISHLLSGLLDVSKGHPVGGGSKRPILHVYGKLFVL